MKNIRLGFKRKRGKVRIGPELTVEANREMKFYADSTPIWPPLMGTLPPQSLASELSSSDFIKIVVRWHKELKDRGYPEDWIEKDLARLMEGI